MYIIDEKLVARSQRGSNMGHDNIIRLSMSKHIDTQNIMKCIYQ